MVYVLDGGGPKDSKNTLNSFFTKRDANAFWQIGADMKIVTSQFIQCLVNKKGEKTAFWNKVLGPGGLLNGKEKKTLIKNFRW